MTKKTFLGAMAVVMAVALTGTALVASNMGFKLNYTLAKSAGGSDAGFTTLALPDNRQTGLNDSKNLMDDIGSASVLELDRYLKATNSYYIYTGRKSGSTPPGTAFGLTAGEGYFVKMNTTVNYIVVGSDDPSLAYALAKSAGGSDAGFNLYQYNYHQTAADSKALMDDVGSASVLEIDKYLKASNSYYIYTGRKSGSTPPGTAFTLAPGEAYFVKMNTTVNYIPSHY
jgi:hypothetical protein